MNVKKATLSKSKFLAGMQCPKRLYLLCHQPELAAEPDEQLLALFAQGQELGRLAQQAYPAGVLLDEHYLDHREAVTHTGALMADSRVSAIFEGAFSFDDIYIRVDILRRLPGNRWRLIEVKSSARVDDKHIPDVAIQKHVLQRCGHKVADACLMHVNRQYRYDGMSYNLRKLFTLHSLNNEIRIFEKELPAHLASQWQVLAMKKAPDVACGSRCTTPFACEFYEFCHRGKGDDWVGNLPGIGKKLDQLTAMGVESVHDIPGSFHLTGIQKRACECIINNRIYFDGNLAAALAKLTHPLYFMDFETAFPALPRYEGMHPYDQIPFQWSVHLRRTPGSELKHFEFLNREGKDPRRRFITSLLSVLEKHPRAPIVVYSAFEASCLNLLAGLFPEYAERIEAVIKRLRDLLKIIRSHVYHPRFMGSFSIKYVLPALVPEMSYDNMEVADGLQAGIAYERLISDGIGSKEKERLEKALLAYCRQDSLAMVKLLEHLEKV